jgi:hypothetical protein
MGGKFIIGVTIVSGGFKGIPIMTHLGLLRNNLNSYFLKALLDTLLLLASFVTFSSNHFLGIRGHPSFVT